MTHPGVMEHAIHALTREVDAVRNGAERFARLTLSRKISLLDEIRARLARRGVELAELGCRAKGLPSQGRSFGEELLAGAVIIQRSVGLLRGSLQSLHDRGATLDDSRLGWLRSGQAAVQVMPHDVADRALFLRVDVEVRLARGVSPTSTREVTASFYRSSRPEGRVALVLGAGNVASIPALDVLHQSFVEGRACVLKMSPVNQYLGPVFEDVFRPLIEADALRIVYGGAEVGAALLEDARIDHVHMTGSTETHDRIVWGASPEERSRRKQRGEPKLRQTISSELGNISPVVVVPCRYTERELDWIAESVAGMLFNNAGFNCNAAKLLVVSRRNERALLERLERWFFAEPERLAYYPGAVQRYDELTRQAHVIRREPPRGDGRLPWTLVTGLKPEDDAPQFRVEPFCPLLSVVTFDDADPEEYLARVTPFLNDKVWGTLNAMLFVSDSAARDPALARAVERSLTELRYGSVAVNAWPALAYGLGTPPWGGHPSATLADAQSGLGFVHNTCLLEGIEKSVLRAPLAPFPKPVWFPSHRRLEPVARALFRYESRRDPVSFARTAFHGLRG